MGDSWDGYTPATRIPGHGSLACGRACSRGDCQCSLWAPSLRRLLQAFASLCPVLFSGQSHGPRGQPGTSPVSTSSPSALSQGRTCAGARKPQQHCVKSELTLRCSAPGTCPAGQAEIETLPVMAPRLAPSPPVLPPLSHPKLPVAAFSGVPTLGSVSGNLTRDTVQI